MSKEYTYQMQGGLEKIGDIPKQESCNSSEHNPPMHIVLPDGIYRYTCPMCGKVTEFRVQSPVFGV